MASSEGIAAADLVEKVPSSRQVRYEGRVMNIEAVQRAEKEMEEARLRIERLKLEKAARNNQKRRNNSIL